MKCIFSPFSRCYENIASEEYFLTHFEGDVFYLYINSPCVIVGKHQNTYAEINPSYIQKHKIDVVRRNSGGGSVYHDHGNLNFGFISKNQGKDILEIFQEFTKPVLTMLNNLGVNAVFAGRNDLTIDGKKFSGNAQYHTPDKVLLHGTLLFSSDLDKISGALHVDSQKFQDKGIKSIKSRVTNILPHLQSPISIDEFASTLFRTMLTTFPGATEYTLTDYDQEQIQLLSESKYSTWEWTYGNSPEFTYRNTLKYDLGLLDMGVQVDAGIIRGITVYGDFFGTKDLNEVLDRLKGLPFEKNAVGHALENIAMGEYIFGLSNQSFCHCMFPSPADFNTTNQNTAEEFEEK